ncbi:unnamed protein product [Symbiodinium natans]|uniref:Uncharacterized protein n=1 Tax=Symbiodinium natans TaxID=878477 RepID=A0A812PXW7_9DINO|nr:unnamed protein product [Symbiodinium natans]
MNTKPDAVPPGDWGADAPVSSSKQEDTKTDAVPPGNWGADSRASKKLEPVSVEELWSRLRNCSYNHCHLPTMLQAIAGCDDIRHHPSKVSLQLLSWNFSGAVRLSDQLAQNAEARDLATQLLSAMALLAKACSAKRDEAPGAKLARPTTPSANLTRPATPSAKLTKDVEQETEEMLIRDLKNSLPLSVAALGSKFGARFRSLALRKRKNTFFPWLRKIPGIMVPSSCTGPEMVMREGLEGPYPAGPLPPRCRKRAGHDEVTSTSYATQATSSTSKARRTLTLGNLQLTHPPLFGAFGAWPEASAWQRNGW